MKGSDYIFNHVNSLEYHFHKVSINGGSSYIPSPDWLSHKKATINPYNYADNRCFLYAIIIALNSQNTDNHPERILNLGNLLIITIGIIFVFQQGIKTILRSRKTIATLQ